MLVSWNKLTSALEARSVAFESISLSLSKMVTVDSGIIKDVRERRVALQSLLQLLTRPDSGSIQQIVEENKKLLRSFLKVTALMMDDPAFSSKKESAEFQTQLIGLENRILSARKRYNELMRSKQREDLMYP